MSGWLTELTHSMGLACEESAGYHTRPLSKQWYCNYINEGNNHDAIAQSPPVSPSRGSRINIGGFIKLVVPSWRRERIRSAINISGRGSPIDDR